MPPLLDVEVVSPEAVNYTGPAEMVIARTTEGGDIAFMPGHVPFVGVLAVWGVDVVTGDGGRDVFAVHRGFVQVSGSTVTILSDVSEAAGEIDVERARLALSAARDDLVRDSTDSVAAASLERAELRLRVAGALPT